MKYRALVHIPPGVKAGDIVEINDPLIPEYQGKLEPVGDNEAVDVPSKSAIINPSLDDLKEHLASNGIEWSDDMTVVDLFAKLQEAHDKQQAEAEGKVDDGTNADDDTNDATVPERTALKSRAAELGLNVASNIPTARLRELVKEAEEKAAQ
jgi:hypothetical protein